MSRSIEKKLAVTLSITVLILAAEAAGGLISNSLALLSDAGHVLTDAFALGLSLAAVVISRRPRDGRATYGYHRATLIAASINGASLLIIAGFIFHESFQRFVEPPVVNLALMMPVAVAGLIANLIMAGILGHSHGDLNLRSAWLHVLGDTLSSVGVIVSGGIIHYTGWALADPLAGLLIGVIIVLGGSRVLWSSLQILLDLVPEKFELDAVTAEVQGVSGVQGVHHVHLRSLSHGKYSFSAHLCVEDMMLSKAGEVRNEVERRLADMGIGHVLLQLESDVHDGDGKGAACKPCATSRHGHGAPDAHHGHGH